MAASRVDRARDEEASHYAPEVFREAETSLALAREALSDSRRYREAVRQAARACLRADEARRRAAAEQEKLSRWTDRSIRECEALLEQARDLGAEIGHAGELETFVARHAAIVNALAEGRVSDAHAAAIQLKDALLIWLHQLQRAVP